VFLKVEKNIWMMWFSLKHLIRKVKHVFRAKGQMKTHKSIMASMLLSNKETVAQNHNCPNDVLRPTKGL